MSFYSHLYSSLYPIQIIDIKQFYLYLQGEIKYTFYDSYVMVTIYLIL